MAQSFVRALKASSDPPQPGGLSKIEISRSVWDDTSFHVPNKGEVIVDWILTRLLKDRTKNSPVLDCRFWELLSDVISPTDQLPSAGVRPVKTWLPPLLSHIPIASIAIAFLNLLASLDNVARQRLAHVVLRCFRVLWPLGVHKLTAETLSDCFSAVLSTFKECESNESLAHISLIMTSSFRTSLGNALNKKKLHNTFTQTQLHLWIECVSAQPCPSNVSGSLLDNIYAAGVETLFNLDTLRQQHSRSEDPLFQALAKNLGMLPSLAITVLPRIFNSYVQCIKKYRGALFSQSSTHPSSTASEELRLAAMNFFASCCSAIEHADGDDHFWATRVALLSIVDSENLFSTRQPDMDQLLKRNGELAIRALSSARKEDNTGDTKLAIDILSTLTRIDYDIIVPAIPRILPKILLVHWPLQIPELNKSVLVFLDLLLDYHVKTRTLHIYIQYLFAALAQPSVFSLDPQSLYQAASSGPLLNLNHLDKLGKCVHGFMASGQIVETVRKVFHCLKDAWEQFYDISSGECSRNRGKVEAATGKGSNVEALAVTFSLSARIASVVLRSLPVQSVPEAVRRDVQILANEAQTAFFHTCLAQTVGTKHARDGRDVWSQIVAAATLRFQYVLEASRDIHLQTPDPKLSKKILDMLDDDEILPEFRLEMFRILLAQSAQGTLVDSTVLLDSLFNYLDRHFDAEGISWSGLSCQLTLNERGKREAALALFHLMIDRWMPVVDRIASRRHLERLAHLLLSIRLEEDIPSSMTNVMRPSACLELALCSAEFWELPNVRKDIFLSVLIDKTSTLDGIDASQSCSSDMQHAILAYHTLLFVPIEYISRTARTDFVKRALTADIIVSNMNTVDCRPLTILRTFLKRVFVYLGAVDQTAGHQFLEHMLNSSNSPTAELSLVTLDLIEIHFLSLLRSGSQAILEMLKTLATSLSDVSDNGQVKRRALVRLIGLLATSFSPSRFSDEVRAVMVELRECLLVTVLPKMVAVTAEGAALDQTLVIDLFNIWCQILSFGRWLCLNDAAPKFGRRLVKRVLSSSCSPNSADRIFEDMSAATLVILLEELHLYSEADRLQHVGVIIAAYVSLSRKFGSYRLKNFDDCISKTCKFFSALDFSRFLDVVLEGLVTSNNPADLKCLTYLSVLLLHEAPQGTLQPIQKFITRSLNIFSDQHIFSVGPSSLRLQVLDFVSKHCSDRPASLRSVDLNSIWSLLSKFFTKSRDHDETTLTPIFHEIANIISSVIRFRRDLVVMTLPHLGMILRQMVMSIRGVRPQLGAKQSKLVTETLPRWINASQPLTADEGKVLARLLVTLTTKNIARTHSSRVQKAESLAQPFSKHAAYVLKAYIEVMNDPLCIVSFELRRELEPGLFALCSMLSEHSRDAMMVSALDAGGKMTLKSLWREYEKQKYVGKG